MSKDHKKDHRSPSKAASSPEKKHHHKESSKTSPAASAAAGDQQQHRHHHHSHKEHHHHHKDRSKDSSHQHKKHKNNPDHVNGSGGGGSGDHRPNALKMDVKLEPLNHSDILGELNSSLSGYNNGLLYQSATSSHSFLKPKSEPIYDPNLGFTSRKARTLVYAGHSRATHSGHVPRLEDLCLNLLSDNLDKITCLGDAPYFLIKPVLAKCNPIQLRRIEKYNEHLIDEEETDELWQIHAETEFKGCPDKHRKETFRDYFHRAQQERDMRLKKLTSKIQKKSVKDNAPVKKTMVVDSVPSKGRKLPAGTKSFTQAAAVTAAEIKKTAKETRVGAAKPERRTGPLMAKTMKMFKRVTSNRR